MRFTSLRVLHHRTHLSATCRPPYFRWNTEQNAQRQLSRPFLRYTVWLRETSWQLPAKLVAHCNTRVQYSGCGLTIRATPGLRKQKPQKSTNSLVLHTRGPFLGRSFPVVAGTPLQTRKGRCSVAEKSFGMYNICIHGIVFELCVTEERRRRRKKMNKIDFFAFGFLGLVKG